MLIMIGKMSAVTVLYVIVTVLIWEKNKGRKISVPGKVTIGLIYGLASVLSTHFGVNYNHMMLNVRDLGPLSAGLFFDPLSGIIAGLIGGIERYIAGTYWGVGSYTRIACSVSTCLAGFLSAFMSIFIFKRKKPSAIFAFFMGAVMEVFHMYVVLITHRSDMSMAFYVVKICSVPMIIFTGLGLAASSTALIICSGEWKNPFRKLTEEEVPVSQKFQFWLFAVTFAILLFNLVFSFVTQTQTAIQEARSTLTTVSGDIREMYLQFGETVVGIEEISGETAGIEASAIAVAAEMSGGIGKVDNAFLEEMRNLFGLTAVAAVDKSGATVAEAGDAKQFSELFHKMMTVGTEKVVQNETGEYSATLAALRDGVIMTVISKNAFVSSLNLDKLSDALSCLHVGIEGSFDIIDKNGLIVSGAHKGKKLAEAEFAFVKAQPDGSFFETGIFGSQALCRTENLYDGSILFVQIPVSEIYTSRDEQTYESIFAAIILFAVIYVLISMLVQRIVVENLQMVNLSLDRITNGNLDEIVSVRNSSEFASLSNDINQTVTVLKGYISAAEKRIEQELEFARTIQDSALPKNFIFPRNDFEIYATMDPAKEIGGDFYDYFFVDRNKLAMVIADVSGKGIPAALFMMRAKTAIRGLAESGQAPGEILRRANMTLCEGNDAEMFVTVWLGIIDMLTGHMTCANAGHEYPAIMRAGETFEILKDKHAPVLAAMEGIKFRDYELELNPGDRLFVYTDGVPEAINKAEEQYGLDRMVNALNRVKNEKMEVILPAVRKDIADFVDGADQFDDITMLGFTYKGPEAENE